MIVALNLKAYNDAIGKKSLKYLKACEYVAKKYKNIKIILIPNIVDLSLIKLKAKYTKIFAPHVENIDKDGKFTGKFTLSNFEELKLDGVLLNHSENRIPFETIEQIVKKSKEKNFETLVCAKDLIEAKKISKLQPNYVAYEDPLLIGSGIAISKAKSSDVKKFVKMVEDFTIPLCGAGISNEEDVKIAFELGVKGVLIASAFVKAENPRRFLEKIAKILTNFQY